ncbi:hypothetical protein G3I76_40255, partial [Streptomyces sp. SID11233]|nr:hypothetical protein [Streptomyces sp. SID11233]
MSVLDTLEGNLIIAAGAMVALAGALLLVRIWRGPSMLDRAVALDVVAALITAGIGVKAAWDRDPF